MSLSNKVRDLLLSALGSPEARDELITEVETGSGSLSNILAGTNITLSLVNGQLTINAGDIDSNVSSLNTLTGAVVLSAGSNITITPSGNTLTIASTGGGVTSVGASSPLASSGGTTPSISLTGIVGLTNGGTGQATANDGLNALLPTQTSNSGKVLQTDGTNTSWQTVSGSGANTALSNLSSVAFNTSLIPDTNIAYDIGSSSSNIQNLYVGHYIYNTSLLAIDVLNDYLYDNNNTGNLIVDWSSCILQDSTNANVSINWNTRQLFNSSGSLVMTFDDLVTYDTSGNESIDWNGRLLWANDGGTLMADWHDPSVTTVIKYIPTDSSKWSGNPATIGEAIDRLAAVVGTATPIP